MKKRFGTFLVTAIALGVWHIAPADGQTTRSSSSSSSSYSSSTGPAGNSYSSSTSSSTITLNDTALIPSLATASQITRTPIFLSEGAANVISTSGLKVTISERNLSPDKLLAKMIRGTGLIVVPIGSNVCILTQDDSLDELRANVAAAIEAGTEQVKGLIPFSAIQLADALRKPITLTMIQTPVPFVVQMLEGMAGVKILLPREYQDHFFTQQPLISINAQGQLLGEVLKSVAAQLGCELDVSQGVIAIRKTAL